MKNILPKYFNKYKNLLILFIGLISLSSIILYGLLLLKAENEKLNLHTDNLKKELISSQKAFTDLKNEDQYKRNEKLEKDIKSIETTYKKSVSSYEKLLDIKTASKKTDKFDELFAESLTYLSQRNYSSGEATLADLNKQIDDEKAKIAAAFVTANTTSTPNTPVVTNNTAPSGGYSRQSVNSDIGTFLVDIVAADLNSAKVIVDTASESDCGNNCPVLSLGDYVSRSGAFAGVNGSYFCPAEYPSCKDRTNSFDTLLMNKNKKYFNSDNNKYSAVPLIYFSGSSSGVRGQSLDWGRDTGVDMVLANQSLLLSGGNIAFGGDGDPKKGGKGSRSFVGSKGSTAYIGVVHNATVAEVAHALKALGLENALNLDSGGSTALWSGGYRLGPGRNLPNVVLFVRK